jgi:hypothetical protein
MIFELIPNEKHEMELLEWAKPTWPQPSQPIPQGLSARGRSRGALRCSTAAPIPVSGSAVRWGRGSERWPVRWGLDLVTDEGGGSPEGGVHGCAAQSKGNGSEGGIRSWRSAAHDSGRWSGHGRSLGWRRWSTSVARCG